MFPVSIKGVLLTSEHEVLLALNCRDEWELPGGRIEVGEQPHETVEREFLEEANVRVQAQRLIDSYLFEVIPGKHVFIATYGCVSNGPFAPEVSHEHRKLALFPVSALPPNLPIGYRRSFEVWHATLYGRAGIFGRAGLSVRDAFGQTPGAAWQIVDLSRR